ncbi:MAG: diguanylate cyclase [Kineosporiaceae bacterium]
MNDAVLHGARGGQQVREGIRQARRLELLVELGLLRAGDHGRQSAPADGAPGAQAAPSRVVPTAPDAADGAAHPAMAELDDLAALAAMVAGSPCAAVSVALPERLLLAGEYGCGTRTFELPEEVTMCGHVVATADPVSLVHTAPDPRFAGNRLVESGLIDGYTGYPVTVDGQVLASLCVFGGDPVSLDARQHRQLAALARQAEHWLRQRLEIERLRQDGDRHRAEREVLARVSGDSPPEEVLGVLVAEAAGAADGVGVMVLGRSGRGGDGVLRLVAARGVPEALAQACAQLRVEPAEGPLAAVYLDGRPADLDLGGNLDVTPVPAAGRRAGATWARAVPLPAGEGGCPGLIVAVARRKGALDEPLRRRLAAAAALAGAVLDPGPVVGRGAVRDGLTGLATRPGLLAAAQEALRGVPAPHSVLLVDVDRLKVVNDSLGDAGGDEVLRATAARLRAAVRPRDLLARLGGDEFVVLCPSTTAAEARDLADEVVVALARPVVHAGAGVAVSASVGVAVLAGVGALAEVLRSAERAVLAAKAGGRGHVAVADVDDGRLARETGVLELDLRRLLSGADDASTQLSLVYQPQFDLTDATVHAVEALARWSHPVLGPIPPGRFIALAEDAGLMVELGGFVLDEAVRQQARWSAEGSAWAASVVWVNVSGRQLEGSGFARRVEESLRRNDVAPDRLGLEITESVLTGHTFVAREELRSLRDLGVRLAIDDFGTGFSNLAMLRSAPVGAVKIDRGLVSGMGRDREGTRLVDAVLGLAEVFDLDVVAEGVETEDQLAALAGRGATVVQGFLLARPVPAEGLDAARRQGTAVLEGARVPRPHLAAGPDLTGFRDFEAAARAVLRRLREETGLRQWAITRASGANQVVLVSDADPDIPAMVEGASLPWEDSLCVRMVEGGPRVATRIDDVPAYACAPNRGRLPTPVAAYVGMPLHDHTGALFGTLCAFDPEPAPEHLRRVEPRISLMAQMLSTVLARDLVADELQRKLERAEAEATSDPLTGLANRRGWSHVLEREEARCRRYGHPATVIVLDLDDLKRVNDASGHAAGDQLLRTTAAQLRAHVRAGDLVARLGGDEFGVLAVQADLSGARVEADRLQRALVRSGVRGSFGVGERGPTGTLERAWQVADAAMYEAKRWRRRDAGGAVSRPQA